LKHSYLTAGITLDQFWRLLKRNKPAYTLKNTFRIVFLFQSAIWSSLFAAAEKARYSARLKNAPVPDDLIFIIGHWRTGSTLLHQIMSLDPQLAAPSLFEVAVPDSFLVSYPYYRPLFKRVISRHRPMDMVSIGMDEPQEDEYAFYRLTCYSPLENLVFSKSESYFLNHGASFLPPEDKMEEWKKEVKDFYRKLYFKRKKRIVSKNPFNSFRIKVLHEMFPGARFIHIVRNPCDVIPSTIHMWDILQKQNRLNKPLSAPGFDETLGVFGNLMSVIDTDRRLLEPGYYTEVRFEDLEVNPVDTLKSMYRELNIPFTAEFEEKINRFVRKTRDYRKNKFSLSPEERSLIRQTMGKIMEKYHYV